MRQFFFLFFLLLFILPLSFVEAGNTVSVNFGGPMKALDWSVTSAPGCDPDTNYPNIADGIESTWKASPAPTTAIGTQPFTARTVQAPVSGVSSSWSFICTAVGFPAISDTSTLIVCNNTTHESDGGSGCVLKAASAPPVPGGVTAVTSGTCGGNINVSSTGSAGATSYEISVNGGTTWPYTGIASFPYTISGLSPSTGYSVSVRARNASGASAGSVPIAVTSSAVCVGPTTPTLSTPVHLAVTQTSVTVGATLVSDGGSSVTVRGMCLGTGANPTSCTAIGGTSLGAFTRDYTGLTCGTTYYYRGYATNGVGTGYSNDGSFTTNACAAVGVDLTVTNISPAHGASVSGLVDVVVRGNVRNSGAAAATEAGLTALELDTNGDGTADSSYDPYGGKIGPLCGGGCNRDLSYTFPATVTPGTYYYRFRVDTAGEQAESDETNNASPWYQVIVTDGSAPSGPPIVFPPTPPGGCPGFYASWSVSGDSCTGVVNPVSQGSMSGAVSNAATPGWTGNFGWHGYVCQAADTWIDDPNNEPTCFPPPRPDLIVNASTFPAGPITRGSEITLRGTVRNSGTANTSSGFSNNFSYSTNNGVTWNNLPHLAKGVLNAGSTATEDTQAYTPTATGNIRFQYCVDSLWEINNESSEGNNCVQSGNIVVNPPPPGTPTNFNGVPGSCGGRIDLTWDPTADASTYEISLDNGSNWPPMYTGIGGTSYTITGLPINTNYPQIRLRARNASGVSVPTAGPILVIASDACNALSGVDCTIADNSGDTCSGQVTWDITGAASPRILNTYTGTPAVAPFTNHVGNNIAMTLRYRDNVIQAQDQAVPIVLNSITLVAQCSPTSFFHVGLNQCKRRPDIAITPNPLWIRSGKQADLTFSINANYNLNCRLDGGFIGSPTFVHNASAAPVSYPYQTVALTAAQMVRITCNTPGNDMVPPATAEVRVNVLPAIQET